MVVKVPCPDRTRPGFASVEGKSARTLRLRTVAPKQAQAGVYRTPAGRSHSRATTYSMSLSGMLVCIPLTMYALMMVGLAP